MTPSATDVAAQLYARWNDDGLAALASESVDPAVELVCDPLRPEESTLRGVDGWLAWAARWDEGYEAMRITIDGLIPMGPDHVLALVSFSATPRGGNHELTWAAAHVWTMRDGRVARWESHVDIALARGTLL
jgi:ketosteroid isomerase-like protein